MQQTHLTTNNKTPPHNHIAINSIVNNLKYIIGAILAIPLLPIMYIQGRKIRSKVPKLPDASAPEGVVKTINKSTQNPIRIVALGESTIAGVGVKTHQDGMVAAFAKELAGRLKSDVHWKVFAKSGYTAKDINQNIIPVLRQEQADIVLIGLGGNDAFSLNGPWRWRAEMHSMIESLRKMHPEAAIALCNMPPIKEFPAFTPLIRFVVGNLVELLGDALRNLTTEFNNTIYFDEKITLESWIKKYNLPSNRSAFFSDGVHPSKLTYHIWGKYMADKLANNKVK